MPAGRLISLIAIGWTIFSFPSTAIEASPWTPLIDDSLSQHLLLNSPQSLATGSSAQIENRNRAIQLYRVDKFAEAVKILRSVVKDDKTDHEAWYFMGLALLPQGKNKDAARAFETAIKLQPRFAAAHTGLAYAALQRRKSSEAVLAARAALNIDPKIAEPHYIIGVVHITAKDFEEALNEANEAVRLGPEFAPAYLLKGQALIGVSAKRSLDASRFTRTASPPPTPEERVEQLQKRKATATLYKEAAESLQTYLKLNPKAPSSEFLREQLVTLEVYGNYASEKTDPSQRPFSGGEVTTKARVTMKPEPMYTEAARKAQVVGTVVLRAVLGADGTVNHILVLASLPHGLTEAAVRAARMIKFVPATVNGRQVSMFVQLEYSFNLY